MLRIYFANLLGFLAQGWENGFIIHKVGKLLSQIDLRQGKHLWVTMNIGEFDTQTF